MNTTSLRIEILIIGFQATVWVLLFSGISVADITLELSKWKDQSAVLSIIFLVWFYSFGAVVDGVTGAIEDPKSLWPRNTSNNPSSPVLWLKYPEATKELLQSYYDLRLLRSTAFNLLLFSIAAVYANLPTLIGIFSFGSAVLVAASWFRRRNRIAQRKKRLCEKADELA